MILAEVKNVKRLKITLTAKKNKLVYAEDLHEFLGLYINQDKWIENICKNMIQNKDYIIKDNKVIFSFKSVNVILDSYLNELNKGVTYWSDQYQLATMKISKRTYKSLIDLAQSDISRIKKEM